MQGDSSSGSSSGGGAPYTLNNFVQSMGAQSGGRAKLELENPHTVVARLKDELLWIKLGTMVAYSGSIKFSREGMAEHGIGKMFKKMATGEGATLAKAEGTGTLYLGDFAKHVHIIHLNNESVVLNGNDILAFEPSLKWDIKMMKKIGGMLQGGLFNVKYEGTGMIALTTHGHPIALQVTADHPVIADPQACVMWSGNLSPSLKTDIKFKSLIGRGSGEELQMKFEGDSGFVLVQPCEELSRALRKN
ncbi:DUF124 domain-containing protein [Balamuthia mandrillaris]